MTARHGSNRCFTEVSPIIRSRRTGTQRAIAFPFFDNAVSGQPANLRPLWFANQRPKVKFAVQSALDSRKFMSSWQNRWSETNKGYTQEMLQFIDETVLV